MLKRRHVPANLCQCFVSRLQGELECRSVNAREIGVKSGHIFQYAAELRARRIRDLSLVHFWLWR